MRVWHIKVAYDDSFEYTIKNYLVQYENRYTAAMVEDEERIKLFAECGSAAHFLDISVTDVTKQEQADEDDFVTFPDEDGDDDEFNAPLNVEW